MNVRKNEYLAHSPKKTYDIQYTLKYLNTQEYPGRSESKKDTWKYRIVEFNTPTRPEPDPLPGIFSITRPNIEKPYSLGIGGGKR